MLHPTPSLAPLLPPGTAVCALEQPPLAHQHDCHRQPQAGLRRQRGGVPRLEAAAMPPALCIFGDSSWSVALRLHLDRDAFALNSACCPSPDTPVTRLHPSPLAAGGLASPATTCSRCSARRRAATTSTPQSSQTPPQRCAAWAAMGGSRRACNGCGSWQLVRHGRAGSAARMGPAVRASSVCHLLQSMLQAQRQLIAGNGSNCARLPCAPWAPLWAGA
jgi:hypothetical protein